MLVPFKFIQNFATNKLFKQAGTELGQAQLPTQTRLDFDLIASILPDTLQTPYRHPPDTLQTPSRHPLDYMIACYDKSLWSLMAPSHCATAGQSYSGSLKFNTFLCIYIYVFQT